MGCERHARGCKASFTDSATPMEPTRPDSFLSGMLPTFHREIDTSSIAIDRVQLFQPTTVHLDRHHGEEAKAVL
jgi:hypothetical protein